MYPEYDTIQIAQPARRRRWPYVVLAALAVILAGLAGTLALLPGEEADVADALGAQSHQQAPTVETIVLEEETGTAPAGGPIQGGEQTTFDPAGPCADDPTFLVARPNPVQLRGGSTKGAVVLHNCGKDKVSWTASTKPWVKLAQANGVLAGGSEHSLGFTVDTKALPLGAYSFKIEIDQPGHPTEVVVKGTKLGGLAAPSPKPSPPGVGGLVGNGPSACAMQCISKAWLTPIHGTAHVSLEVKTKAQAKIMAWVDPEAPKHNNTGNPYFTSPDVHVASADYRTQWVTALKPLKPGTKYHIIVAAKDVKGGVSYQEGTFTSPEPVAGLAANEPGGCKANCVESAVLTPVPGTAQAKVTVITHVPAKLQVFANGVTVASSQSQFFTEFATTLQLEHDKSYEIKLKVTDEQGNTQTHQAGYTTPPEPQTDHQNTVVLVFHKIYISNDADNTVFNRAGELRFLFEVNGEPVFHTDEMRIKARHTLSLNGADRTSYVFVIDDAPDTLRIRVQAHEYDRGGAGACFGPSGWLFDGVSGRDDSSCREVEWNTAIGEIDLHATPSWEVDQALPPPCDVPSGYCHVLSARGDDPHFDVHVSAHLAD